jgi:hypothetical protein
MLQNFLLEFKSEEKRETLSTDFENLQIGYHPKNHYAKIFASESLKKIEILGYVHLFTQEQIAPLMDWIKRYQATNDAILTFVLDEVSPYIFTIPQKKHSASIFESIINVFKKSNLYILKGNFAPEITRAGSFQKLQDFVNIIKNFLLSFFDICVIFFKNFVQSYSSDDRKIWG